MQTVSSRRSSSLSSQSRRVAVFAILLFALAGLIGGFAVGGFVRPKIGGIGPSNSNTINNPVVQQTKTATPASGPQPVRIPTPTIDHFESPNIANGTVYNLTAHLENVLGRDGQPVHASNLTCKMWLISRVPDGQHVSIPSDILTNVSSISNPITSQVASVSYPEIQSSLVFDDTTPQTQSCRTDGEVKWQYRISTSATPGKYTLVVLYDWSGKHYNWSWADLTIRHANPN